MTTMELKSLKMDLVEELLSLNDKEMLNRVKNYLKRLKKMEAGKASIMAFIEPMIATICGILVFGEKFTLGNLTGVVLILASIIFLNTKMKIKGRAKHG